MIKEVDVVIIGAGAAGLMCAAVAGQLGKSVILIDHANKPGKKILMSGGGRCNFTNLVVHPEHYISKNPHFCKSALKRYTPSDFVELVDRYGLAYHEKTKGQLFCDHSSKDILNILLAECDLGAVDLQLKTQVKSIEESADYSGLRWQVTLCQGDHYPRIRCRSVVLATGGLSIPTMGASGFGYEVAQTFGLQLQERYASLVPLRLQNKWLEIAQQLSGVSLDVELEANGQYFRESLLFTHRGLSGPAILQISNYWLPGDTLRINFLPEQDLCQSITSDRTQGHKTSLKNWLSKHLPKRFVQVWLEQVNALGDLLNQSIVSLGDQDIKRISKELHSFEIKPSGTEGYRTAEVTMGGIDTNEVSSKTFEVKKVPGLYCIGEVLDVTGWLGGYNFQWAWASAWCAAQYV